MSKYYLEEEPKKKELSLQSYEQFLSKEDVKAIMYIMDVLKEVHLSDEMLKIFIEQFRKIGGNYSVLTDKDTIIGMYNFVDKNSDLTPEAINKLWPKYIKDLFEEYKLEEKYQELIKVLGKYDSTYEVFLLYADVKGKELQQKYEKEALKLTELYGQYSDKFITYLRNLVLRKHIHCDDILKYLPEPALIEEDESKLRDISIYHRIDFGLCNPISYTMIESLIKTGNLDDFDEQPEYIISNTDKKYPTSFSKSDYLQSINNREKNK